MPRLKLLGIHPTKRPVAGAKLASAIEVIDVLSTCLDGVRAASCDLSEIASIGMDATAARGNQTSQLSSNVKSVSLVLHVETVS